jgi:thymidylate synthase ThyX
MIKNKINARIVADSISPQGHRITTFVLTYPRMIHAEVMTHRLFSRNAASSRAIPFKTMVKSVMDDPFIPIAWQVDHKGMQGTKYITDQSMIDYRKVQWIHSGRDRAIDAAMALSQPMIRKRSIDDEGEIVCEGITKQLCNRLLEPFLWYTNLVTVTELDNFYELRCPKYKTPGIGSGPARSRKDWDKKMQFSSALHPSRYPKTEEEWWSYSESGAEIHIQALAEAMWDAQNESTPNQLEAGEWHMPFMGNFDTKKLLELSGQEPEDFELVCRKIATARAARLSYMTFDGVIDYEKDIALHDSLLASGHMSPFEHCARVMSDKEYVSFVKGSLDTIEIDEPNLGQFVAYNKVWNDDPEAGWCNNFKGFIPYRYLVEN